MFEKFGEMNLEELNQAAAGLKKEGDETSLFALAQENGLDKEDVEDYLDDLVPELATVSSAAYGRIKLWKEQPLGDRNVSAAVSVIISMTEIMISGDNKLAAAMLQKGKRPEKIYQAMKSEAEKHKTGGMAVSCGTDKQLQDIIRAYFLDEANLSKVVQEVGRC